MSPDVAVGLLAPFLAVAVAASRYAWERRHPPRTAWHRAPAQSWRQRLLWWRMRRVLRRVNRMHGGCPDCGRVEGHWLGCRRLPARHVR